MRLIPRTNPNHHSARFARSKRLKVVPPTVIVGVKCVPLANGTWALVDERDYERVMQFNWCSYSNGRTTYAQSDHVTMHHFILQKQSEVDHINGDGLDNRRDNLRICTHSKNGMNRRKHRTKTSSRFKGVSFFKPLQKWRAEITIRPNRYYLGVFADEVEAAKAYDRAAIEKFGEFAHLNFPCV